MNWLKKLLAKPVEVRKDPLEMLRERPESVPVLAPDWSIQRSIDLGYDWFYELPEYVVKFIRGWDHEGWVLLPQTILKQVGLFKLGQTKRVAFITYEFVEDAPEWAKSALEEATEGCHES
jgi:hypothetical protein